MTHDKCMFRIVWLVQLWIKWQIVIPKEARSALWLDTWSDLNVIFNHEKHLWFIKSEDMEKLMSHISIYKWKKDFKMIWISQVWSKWQIVIPKEARSELNLEHWTDVAILLVTLEDFSMIWIIRNNHLQDFFNHVNQMMKDVENLTNT